jgi:low affinity Fe/Cu permease
VASALGAALGNAWAMAVVATAGGGWVLLGLRVDFPRWWELTATVGVPFVTLTMVVLLQHTQNHDTRATHLKLDELIRATSDATNQMVAVEEASPDDLDRIRALTRRAG